MEHAKQKQTNELKRSISALMEDQDFVKSLAGTETTDDIQLLLKKKGIESTNEQIKEIMDEGSILGEKLIKDDGELDTEALDSVAGGGVLAGAILAGIFLLGGSATGKGSRALASAGAAFVIGCMAPCP